MFQPLLHRFDHGCSQWFRNLQQSSWVALLRMLLAAPTQQLFVRPCHFVSNLFHILCQDQSKCLASFWDYRRYTHPLVCVCLFHCDNIKLIKPSMFSGAGTAWDRSQDALGLVKPEWSLSWWQPTVNYGIFLCHVLCTKSVDAFCNVNPGLINP